MSVYLGLDASTQSLTATLIEVDGDRREVVARDIDRLRRGVAGVRHGSWRASRRRSGRRRRASADVGGGARSDDGAPRRRDHPREMARLAAISGSAQQHGSVYLNDARPRAAVGISIAAQPLAAQLADGFSRAARRPSGWTRARPRECREIEAAVGGAAALAARHRLAGVRALHRSADPRVRRNANPQAYAATARIHLVSSFLASLLAGADAPIDPGDGSGMNLMDLRRSTWWPEALDATAPDLARRLPRVHAVVDGRRSARAVLARSLRPAGRAGHRLVRRQPVQPDRQRPRARRTARHFARHERHRDAA